MLMTHAYVAEQKPHDPTDAVVWTDVNFKIVTAIFFLVVFGFVCYILIVPINVPAYSNCGIHPNVRL